MKVSKELIERYHQGNCSPEEQHIVEQWLHAEDAEISFPENADLKAMEDKGWKKISGRYNIAVRTDPAGGFKSRNYRILWQLAACMALIFAAAALYYFHEDRKNSHQNGTLVYKVVRTLKGQKLNVSLPDGTVVWLNSESVLRFPSHFKGHLRELEFSGEGYFSVAKDPSKPFVIHTRKTRIQVLGTKFNLRALTAETATSVVVEEGRVKLTGNSGQQQLMLTANKRGVFETTAPFMKTDEVSAGKYIAWKNNELLLDNLTIGQAAETLERWYNVKITISRQELRNEHYTGSFKNPPLKEVLASMGFAVKFSYRQHGQAFILY